MANRDKKGKTEIQKFEYLEDEKSFSDEIKSIFHSFWRAIPWWKKSHICEESWAHLRISVSHLLMNLKFIRKTAELGQ